MVKFRDSEKLQLLTGERQSGGVSHVVHVFALKLTCLPQERSLTTIMYLMSLTEEARTPFSLVDEINQVRWIQFRITMFITLKLNFSGNGRPRRARRAQLPC